MFHRGQQPLRSAVTIAFTVDEDVVVITIEDHQRAAIEGWTDGPFVSDEVVRIYASQPHHREHTTAGRIAMTVDGHPSLAALELVFLGSRLDHLRPPVE